MSASNSDLKPQRRHVQTRKIEVHAYQREDELWDLEAEIIDLKGKDFQLAAVMRLLGEPIHHMVLKLTINTKFDILEANAHSFAIPYSGYCENIGPDYGKLVGLNLIKGFREGVKERLGGIKGCTHITELTKLLPTVAIQAFVGEIFPIIKAPEVTKEPNQKPSFQFNGCHALRTDGEVVKNYHPVWYGYPVPNGEKPQK
jgi:hypothetical protein